VAGERERPGETTRDVGHGDEQLVDELVGGDERRRELVRAFLVGYGQAVADYRAHAELSDRYGARQWPQRARSWLRGRRGNGL
jgi:hypothetical protein